VTHRRENRQILLIFKIEKKQQTSHWISVFDARFIHLSFIVGKKKPSVSNGRLSTNRKWIFSSSSSTQYI